MNYLSRSSPIVTVGIPSYNAGPHLRAAVDSVQSQTFADWELYTHSDPPPDPGERADLERELATRGVAIPAHR